MNKIILLKKKMNIISFLFLIIFESHIQILSIKLTRQDIHYTNELLNKYFGIKQVYSNQSKPFYNKNKTNNHLLKQFFGYGFDPNQNMSNFNPLNLNQNQTEQLSILNRGTCYKESYNRGAGTVVSYCNEKSEDK